MSLHNAHDVELFNENIDRILEEVQKKKFELLEPTKEEQDSVYAVILDFIKQNKRKVYGGYAINALVVDKDKKDAIYSDISSPDIDFYSPEPIVDLMKICNTLHEKKFKGVVGKEAMHKETYSIYVNQQLYCDISYVPRNIYNKMPFREIKGINYTHPHFIMIDYLRMMTDPLISFWRIDKGFKRFVLLQKHYPLPINNNPIEISGSDKSLEHASEVIYDFLRNRKTTITVGFYAYDYYLNESGILDKKDKKFKIVDIPYFEIISSDYKNDSLELIALLKKEFPAGGIKTIESYPFYQYLGFSVAIYLDDNLIAQVYHYNRRCLPFFDVQAKKFSNNKVELDDSNKVRIGTYSLVLLYALVSIMKARVVDDNDTKNLYYTIISHMIEYRNYFFKKNSKNIFDNTLFKDFVVECLGETMEPNREKRLIIESRKKKGRKYTFTYEPENDARQPETNFMFANSSGNPINKDKNKKLLATSSEDDIEGATDDEGEK